MYIDEIASLSYETQIAILTAMQDKVFPISGRSEGSASAVVRTEPVPCDFSLFAAGNYETLENLHPAFLSRLRGYGYIIAMNEKMLDTEENRHKIYRFIAQEIKKDKKIPHFDYYAMEEIVEIARELSPKIGTLTLFFRDLGGYVRSAGDIAIKRNGTIVKQKDVIKAKYLYSFHESMHSSADISLVTNTTPNNDFVLIPPFGMASEVIQYVYAKEVDTIDKTSPVNIIGVRDKKIEERILRFVLSIVAKLNLKGIFIDMSNVIENYYSGMDLSCAVSVLKLRTDVELNIIPIGIVKPDGSVSEAPYTYRAIKNTLQLKKDVLFLLPYETKIHIKKYFPKLRIKFINNIYELIKPAEINYL